MARARVALQEALTFTTPRGKTFKRDAPQILTNAAEIEYLRNTGRFSVSDLAEQPPKQKAVVSPPETDDGFERPEEPVDDSEAPEVKTAKRGLRRRGNK